MFCGLWDIWFHNGEDKTVSRVLYLNRKIGLCEYMRMLLIWGPIMTGFYIAIASWIGYVFLVMPIMSGGIGFISIGFSILFLLAMVAIIVGVFFTIFVLDFTKNKILDKLEDITEANDEKDDEEKSIIIEYYKETKDKVCPIMEIK
jgi:hypothetical protein